MYIHTDDVYTFKKISDALKEEYMYVFELLYAIITTKTPNCNCHSYCKSVPKYL